MIEVERGAGKRVEGIDLARGLALLGMVFVNFRVAIATEGNVDRTNWLSWLYTRLNGRAAATLVILTTVSPNFGS